MSTPRDTLDRGSGVPLYRQIKQVLVGELQKGPAPIMTEQELIKRFRVSRATVRQALQELVNDGLVYRDRAKGTFPVQQVDIERPASLKLGGLVGYLAEQGLDPTSEVRDVQRAIPPESVRAALMLDPGETVLMFSRRVLSEGQPLSLAKIYLRSADEFFPSVAELEAAGSAIALLERLFGISVARAEHHVWARGAAAEESAALGIAIADPVLTLESVMSTREGHPVAWRRVVDRAESIKHIFVSAPESS